MPWYGKYEEESSEEKLENRIKELEDKEKRRNDDDCFTMKSKYGEND